MKTNAKCKKLSEAEIDGIVVSEAGNNSARTSLIRVRRRMSASLYMPAELTARAAFVARLHHQPGTEEWLTHIIRERVELEEAAFVGAKRELATKNEA